MGIASNFGLFSFVMSIQTLANQSLRLPNNELSHIAFENRNSRQKDLSLRRMECIPLAT